MSGMHIRYLAYFGPNRPDADLEFQPGLNVICGASETGKSFLVDSIDFMLGQETPVRGIPERDGYDRIRLLIESKEWPPLTLDRSVEGGHFAAYEEALRSGQPSTEKNTLKYKHSAARQDTLSHELLVRTGLDSKRLRRNAKGDTRSLSFRDLARLCVVSEEEIQSRRSPLLSGQHLSVTPEYAAFKLILTGTDDSALVSAKETTGRRELDTGKIVLLNQMIEDIQTELDEEGIEEAELRDQLSKLNTGVDEQNSALTHVQKALNELLATRAEAAKELQSRRARIAEIDELVGRFNLLDTHYETDLTRLEAIHESGSLFVHLEQKPCPLCGAPVEHQHLDTDCEGNTEAVVQAADAEMIKITRLRHELDETVKSLQAESETLSNSIKEFQNSYNASQNELNEIAVPAVSEERTSYNQLVTLRAQVQTGLEKIERLNRLIDQRDGLEASDTDESGSSTATRTQVSTNVLDGFAKTIEGILEEWHYPNASRVFFDETKRDFQIGGKERGSSGKGLRAITHAAVNIGLMVFCKEQGLPHPGFVVLDSPLLAYWKPEGQEDDLRGTDLKEMFYRHLLGMHKDNQIIVIENEHPPDFVAQQAPVTVFTKNPHHGRYGFFPQWK